MVYLLLHYECIWVLYHKVHDLKYMLQVYHNRVLGEWLMRKKYDDSIEYFRKSIDSHNI